jgi:hypothetical protein
MATVEKMAVINVDPDVPAAIDRALAGVCDPYRCPPPLPRAEMSIRGLNTWIVNCLEMSRKPGFSTEKCPERGHKCLQHLVLAFVY